MGKGFHRGSRELIGLSLLCASLCGCARMEWSSREIIGLSLILVTLTGFIVQAANRLTLDAAGPLENGRLGPVLCFAGLFTCVLGAKFSLINSFGSDIPFWNDEWDVLGPLFSSYRRGVLDPSSLLAHLNEHRHVLTRLFCLDLFELGGQWDPLVQMAANALIHSLVLTGLCLVLWRLAGRKYLAQFCLLTAIAGVVPFAWENTLMGLQSNYYLLIGYSILGMLLLVGSDIFSISWFLGVAALVCAQLSLGSGFLAAAAAICVLALGCLAEPHRLKKALPAIAVLIVLCILGNALNRHVPLHDALKPKGMVNMLRAVAECASWPFWNWALAPIPWVPLFILAWRQVRARKVGGTFEQFLLVLGTWAILTAAAIAYSRGRLCSRFLDFMVIGTLANISAMVFLLDRFAGRFLRLTAITAGAIGLIAGTGAVGLGWKLPGAITAKQGFSAIEEINTARYILTGDPSSIMGKPYLHIPYLDAEGLIEHLKDPVIREILPPCIRLPLQLDPAQGSGFVRGSIPPELPDLPHRVVIGSWKADGENLPAMYASRPVVSRFPKLVFDVAGGGPGISLELVPSSGGAVVRVPIEGEGGRWRQVMAAAPEGSFTVRAVDESRTGRLAFTWPRELATAGFVARKVLAIGSAMMVVGLAVLLAGAVVTRQK